MYAKNIVILQQLWINMSRTTQNTISWLVCCIGAFAQRFGLLNSASYEYLYRYKGLDFLLRNYDIEHTFSIDDAVEDITRICQRNGGTLA